MIIRSSNGCYFQFAVNQEIIQCLLSDLQPVPKASHGGTDGYRAQKHFGTTLLQMWNHDPNKTLFYSRKISKKKRESAIFSHFMISDMFFHP